MSAILSIIGPPCRDNTRRQLLLAGPGINGIDYVEFENPAPNVFVLHVHFLLALPPAAGGSPAAYGLVENPSDIRVLGGTRITGIAVASVALGADAHVLDVTVDAQGDFSPYLLSIGWQQKDVAWQYNFPLDRPFSIAPVNFRPGCPVDFDCAPNTDCAHSLEPEPDLDYLAREIGRAHV